MNRPSPLILSCVVLLGVSSAGADLIRIPSDMPTIQAGIDDAAEGDTLLVAPGVYGESLSLGARGIVIEAAALAGVEGLPPRDVLEKTVIDGGGAKFVIHVSGDGGPVTLRGLTLRNADDGVSPERPVTIAQCRITQTKDGIDFEGGGGLVEYSYFEHNRDDGIDLDGAVAATIRHNQILDNGDDGIEIRLHELEGDSLHTLIAHNRILRNGEDGIQFIDYEMATPRSFLIERNLIAHNAMAGIGFMANAVTVENYEGDSIDERVEVVHNTFVANEYGITGGGDLSVRNSILAHHRQAALKNLGAGGMASHLLLFGNGRDAESAVLTAPILREDPRLDGNYRLRKDSPAIGAGVDDHGSAPDLGAFQRTGE